MEFQILLNLGLQCGNRFYIVRHFKGIIFLTAHLAIPVIILFPSTKETHLIEPQSCMVVEVDKIVKTFLWNPVESSKNWILGMNF